MKTSAWNFSISFSDIAIFDGDFGDFKDFEDFYNIILAIGCVVSAALASGLTNGLMSFDTLKLEIKSMTGSLKEVAAATVILPIIKKHHFVLVTLLLYNALAMEALPIFLGALVPNWMAVLLSVTLVLIFGEIVPSALFTGRDQLFVAARFVPFVNCLLYCLGLISYPISLLLDFVFGCGEEGSHLTRQELEALMQLQKTEENPDLYTLGVNSCRSEKDLSTKEVGILTGVLRLANFVINDVMLKIGDVYCLSADIVLDETYMQEILSRGFSRIPVYNRKDKQHMLGFLLVKSLIVVNPMDRLPLRSVSLREPLVVSPSLRLLEMMRQFQAEHRHLALVSEQPHVAMECLRKGMRPPQEARFVGMVTLEDVLEKILQHDIIDETDVIRVRRGSAQSTKRPAIWDWSMQNSLSAPIPAIQDSIRTFTSDISSDLGLFDSYPTTIEMPLKRN